MTGLELEKEIKAKFEESGWIVKNPDRLKLGSGVCIFPDFAIYSGDNFYGYVDVYYNLKPERLLEKVRQGKLIIRELKPKLYIITDGFEFHVSVYGKEFETLHFVPGPESYYAIVGLIEEYTDYINDKEKKK